MTHSDFGMDTRRRILDAACRTFASFGYDGTSIRQIVEAAGTNVASVNYHFGNKEALYREVIEATFVVFEGELSPIFNDVMRDGSSPESVHAFAQRRIEQGFLAGDDFPPRILGWEILSPRLGPKVILENRLAEQEEKFAALLAPVFGDGLSAEYRSFAFRWFFVATLPPPPVLAGMQQLLGPEPDETALRVLSAQLADAAVAGLSALTNAFDRASRSEPE